jgi:hypothetical protein
MSNTDIQLLVAQARSEADNPAFKVCRAVQHRYLFATGYPFFRGVFFPKLGALESY